MKHGYCHIPLAPLRAEASDKSEMVSQVLFGEFFEVLEKSEKWSRIRTAHDAYEGWMDNKQYDHLFADQFDELRQKPLLRVADQMAKIHVQQALMYVPMGAALPYFDKGSIRLGAKEYSYNGKYSGACRMDEIALSYLNAPYLWGGRSLLGIDCSGFTQNVFAVCGKSIPRDAYQQAELGDTIDFAEEAQEGDLAFFDNEEGRIIHVGMVLKDAKIIHASGRVRIDKLDHEGIYNAETKTYSHRLRIIKRL
jgi:hypothetical protein